MLEGKATIQRVLNRLEGRASYNIWNTSRTELSWILLKNSEPCNFSHSLASCPSADISDGETCPFTFFKLIKFHLIVYIYLHECSNHKENQLYHLISLKARIPIPPSCPCFQHSIMKTPTAGSFLYYESEIPQNASIFWSDLKQATSRNNIELVIFQKYFFAICNTWIIQWI